MIPGYWTIRYTKERTADSSVSLRALLTPAWTYRPGGSALGFVRATKDLALTSVGAGGRASAVALTTGEHRWMDPTEGGAAFIASWDGDLLVYGDGERLRSLDPSTGACRCVRPCPVELGLQDSYIAGDLFVGGYSGELHAVDLHELQQVWAVPNVASHPIVGDEGHLITADEDVRCRDPRTGRPLWERRGADLGGGANRFGCIWRERFFGVMGAHLTSFDLKDGSIEWRWPIGTKGMHWWHPYDGRGYFFLNGIYVIVDLVSGKEVFRRELGSRVPEPVRLEKQGLTAGTRGAGPEHWRDVRLVVSETHAFVQNASGQIVVLERDTGEVVQVVEIDGMPTGAEPVIYENHLLLTDFNAAVHCFKGAA